MILDTLILTRSYVPASSQPLKQCVLIFLFAYAESSTGKVNDLWFDLRCPRSSLRVPEFSNGGDRPWLFRDLSPSL